MSADPRCPLCGGRHLMGACISRDKDSIAGFARAHCFHKTLNERGEHDQWCRGCTALADVLVKFAEER